VPVNSRKPLNDYLILWRLSPNTEWPITAVYKWSAVKCPPRGGTQSRLAWLGRGGQPKAIVAVATWLPLWEPDRGDTNPRLASVQIGGGHSGLGGGHLTALHCIYFKFSHEILPLWRTPKTRSMVHYQVVQMAGNLQLLFTNFSFLARFRGS